MRLSAGDKSVLLQILKFYRGDLSAFVDMILLSEKVNPAQRPARGGLGDLFRSQEGRAREEQIRTKARQGVQRLFQTLLEEDLHKISLRHSWKTINLTNYLELSPNKYEDKRQTLDILWNLAMCTVLDNDALVRVLYDEQRLGQPRILENCQHVIAQLIDANFDILFLPQNLSNV